MESRREKIEAMLREEPNDVFLRYSLAMEWAGEGETDKALAIFLELIQEDPPHVASYFRCAQLLADQGEIEEARRYLREGIEVARAQNDLHTAAEMSEMLSDLGQHEE